MDVKETFKILQMPNKPTALMPLAILNLPKRDTQRSGKLFLRQV
jgi:hypothetical protein